MHRNKVVIIGSGFAGLFATKALKKAPVDITIISRTSHHLFQPLLYQLATGILSAGEIAPNTREILKGQRNAKTVEGLVENIDTASKKVIWRNHNKYYETSYDTLIVAAGAGQSYFGNDHFKTFAPGLKTVDDALELRARIFGAFEKAEIEKDPEKIEKLLTFAVVGAGPTGVEIAGQIRELSSKTLKGQFRNIDSTKSKVLLIDGAPHPLPTFGTRLGNRTTKTLEKLNIDLYMNSIVTDIDASGVSFRDKNGETHHIGCVTKIWAAGVQGSPLGKILADQTGAELTRSGLVKVNPDLTLPNHPEIFVIGDLMSYKNTPGVAQGAIQSAQFVTEIIKNRLAGRQTNNAVFNYHDKGSMATIAKFKAVASIGKTQFSGFFAWILWCFLHLLYIVGFKQRITTLMHWAIAFISHARPECTTTNQQLVGRLALEKLGSHSSGKLFSGEKVEHPEDN